MTKEEFYKAKDLIDKMNHFELKAFQVSDMKERKDDPDFNTLRQLAYDGCNFAKGVFEKQFEAI